MSVESHFPDGLTFHIEICGRPTVSRVLFNHSFWEWESGLPTVHEGQTTDNCDKRKFYLRTSELDIPPFYPIEYSWSVSKDGEVVGRSEDYIYQYKDQRYSWKTMEGENLALWWHDRPEEFGQEVMAVAARAYADQTKFYSSSPVSPITMVIANTSDEFFSWQSEVWDVGGMAFSDSSLTVQLIEEQYGYQNWLNEVIPHEISHIFLYELSKGCVGPALWVNEGLATYNEYSDHWGEWNTINTAYQEDELLSLQTLEYDFGDEPQKRDLAYAEGYYAILYMDEFYGKDSIAKLLSEYDHCTIEAEAFKKVFGKSPEVFESDFVTWLDQRLRTAPPSTEIKQPLPVNENNSQYLLLGMLCFGSMFALLLFTSLGILLVLVIVIHNTDLKSNTHKTRPPD